MTEIALLIFTLMLDAERQFIKDAACSISDITFQSYMSGADGFRITYSDGSSLLKSRHGTFIYQGTVLKYHHNPEE